MSKSGAAAQPVSSIREQQEALSTLVKFARANKVQSITFGKLANSIEDSIEWDVVTLGNNDYFRPLVCDSKEGPCKLLAIVFPKGGSVPFDSSDRVILTGEFQNPNRQEHFLKGNMIMRSQLNNNGIIFKDHRVPTESEFTLYVVKSTIADVAIADSIDYDSASLERIPVVEFSFMSDLPDLPESAQRTLTVFELQALIDCQFEADYNTKSTEIVQNILQNSAPKVRYQAQAAQAAVDRLRTTDGKKHALRAIVKHHYLPEPQPQPVNQSANWETVKTKRHQCGNVLLAAFLFFNPLYWLIAGCVAAAKKEKVWCQLPNLLKTSSERILEKYEISAPPAA